jgi:hypothetical protein
MKKNKLFLVAIVLAALLIRLVISWQDITVLVEKILLDDSLYVISVARNLALGNGLTYNGVDQTNGFQPLWGFMLVPVFWMTSDPNMAINIILTISSIIDVLTVIVLFKLTKKLFNEKIALMTAAFYGLNPLTIFQNLCGIELVLYIFLLLSTMLYYFSLESLKRKNVIILGILLGITMLARLDGIFLTFVIFLDILWKGRKNLLTDIKKILVISVIAALFLAPWFLWCYFAFGNFMQSSAIAKYNMGHGIFPFFDLKEPMNLSDTLAMIGENFVRSGGAIASQLGVVDFGLNAITVALAIVFSASLIASLKNLKKVKMYLLFSVLIILFYNLYLWGVQIRYLTPLIPLFIMLISDGFYTLVTRIKKSDLLVAAFFTLLILVVLVNGIKQWDNGYFPWQKQIYQDALWLKENTSPDDSIGCFSAGIPIYFSERRVVNLDGVVNFGAILALRNHSVIDYMKMENITIWYDTVYFNRTVTQSYVNGTGIDILKQNIWQDFLGDGKDRLQLIEQKEGLYRHLLGFDMLIVFFKARVL